MIRLYHRFYGLFFPVGLTEGLTLCKLYRVFNTELNNNCVHQSFEMNAPKIELNFQVNECNDRLTRNSVFFQSKHCLEIQFNVTHI